MICYKLGYYEDSLGLLAHFRIGEEMRSNDQAMGNMTVNRGRISLQARYGLLKSTDGFKTSSRNVEVGQLRRSVKSGLRKKVNVGKNTFVAGVWFQEGRGKAKKSDDGFYANENKV